MIQPEELRTLVVSDREAKIRELLSLEDKEKIVSILMEALAPSLSEANSEYNHHFWSR